MCVCVCLDTVTECTKSEAEDYIPLDRYMHWFFLFIFSVIICIFYNTVWQVLWHCWLDGRGYPACENTCSYARHIWEVCFGRTVLGVKFLRWIKWNCSSNICCNSRSTDCQQILHFEGALGLWNMDLITVLMVEVFICALLLLLSARACGQ